MGHKGHYGEYSGNAKWSRDHAHTRVTKENYDASERDDAAHIDYLKQDVKWDAHHDHSDENMTADEKHISKLAGDMKYDKEHHGLSRKSRSERLRGRAMRRSERTGAEWGDYDYEDPKVQRMLKKANELEARTGEKIEKDQHKILMQGQWGAPGHEMLHEKMDEYSGNSPFNQLGKCDC